MPAARRDAIISIVIAILSVFINEIFAVIFCILFILHQCRVICDLTKAKTINDQIIRKYESIVTKQIRRYIHDKKNTSSHDRHRKES